MALIIPPFVSERFTRPSSIVNPLDLIERRTCRVLNIGLEGQSHVCAVPIVYTKAHGSAYAGNPQTKVECVGLGLCSYFGGSKLVSAAHFGFSLIDYAKLQEAEVEIVGSEMAPAKWKEKLVIPGFVGEPRPPGELKVPLRRICRIHLTALDGIEIAVPIVWARAGKRGFLSPLAMVEIVGIVWAEPFKRKEYAFGWTFQVPARQYLDMPFGEVEL
jgi:hypothetical protein